MRRSFYTKHREHEIENTLSWQKQNPEKAIQIKNKWHRISVDTGVAAYWSIIQRCGNMACPKYKNYGMRGIKCLMNRDEFMKIYWRTDTCEICGRLLDDKNRNSLAGRTIDRKNNDGNYEINNVRILCRSCNSFHRWSKTCHE